MEVKFTRALKGLLVVVMCVYAVNGSKMRVCFQEPPKSGNRCRVRSRLNPVNNSTDCCLSESAMYYADVIEINWAQFLFFGLSCSPCRGNEEIGSRKENNPCANKVCPEGKVCKIRGSKAKCVCSSCHGSQRRAFQPVCGTDGKGYINECDLKREACKTGRSDVEVAYNGTCQIGCNNVVCRKNRTCMVDQYMRAYCVDCKFHCPKLSKQGGPVCGADGVQYESSCHLRLQTCRQGKSIGEAYKGECVANATCDDINCEGQKPCDEDNINCTVEDKKACVLDNSGKPRCVTCSCEESQMGNSISTELCGSDNQTYKDYCSLRKQVCATKSFIDVQHRGPCKGSPFLGKTNQLKDESSRPDDSKKCEYEDLNMYYVTLRQFVGILRKDFGLNVTAPRMKKLKLNEKFVAVKAVIESLAKKWIKAKQL